MFLKLFDVIFLLTFLINYLFFCDVKCDDVNGENMERNPRDRVGMWFGPRLGKRSHMVVSEGGRREAIARMLEAANVLKYYYEQLPTSYSGQPEEIDIQVPKNMFFTPKLGRSFDPEEKRSHEVDFTPRLGRSRPADQAVTPGDQEFFRNDQLQVEGRSPLFSPRLGRSSQPKLGHNTLYDMFSENVRVVRSTNERNATET